ncbi:lysozyme inhibitor LprI family protein [Sphingomonas sp. DG1-23]|uniref:lysozyme inhibitor LprI family protein n=1 Tax=Sphingomonas sp. DG1-23 TaxID=3068316 RepID=UPI00273E31DD|nr:lysozyme inhibitor LprI family protein [Sphingomonas sp. DG1-23]MDP5280789.1 lysozyme inhibitor LprI family protein [Sphingomonas sp. DG1-23]
MIATALLLLVGVQGLNCDNPIAQSDMTRCEVRRFEAADTAMNKQWKTTLALMRDYDRSPENDGRPGYADQLLKAQRAWLAYRDAHCDSDGYRMRGGSAEPMLVASCRAELTEARAKQLAALAETH